MSDSGREVRRGESYNMCWRGILVVGFRCEFPPERVDVTARPMKKRKERKKKIQRVRGGRQG